MNGDASPARRPRPGWQADRSAVPFAGRAARLVAGADQRGVGGDRVVLARGREPAADVLDEQVDAGLQLEDFVARERDRKSTRLNSSHLVISYAVFCLKKKNKHE